MRKTKELETVETPGRGQAGRDTRATPFNTGKKKRQKFQQEQDKNLYELVKKENIKKEGGLNVKKKKIITRATWLCWH